MQLAGKELWVATPGGGGGGYLTRFWRGMCDRGFKNIPVPYTNFAKCIPDFISIFQQRTLDFIPIFCKCIPDPIPIDDYTKDGGEKLFTKMHCVLIANP